jgi:hypothetical protein
MDPRIEAILERSSEIEALLDDWGFSPSNPHIRARKKAEIVLWLENFKPSEISDAFRLLTKTQYKSARYWAAFPRDTGCTGGQFDKSKVFSAWQLSQ